MASENPIPSQPTGVILFAHGSKVPDANAVISRLAEQVSVQSGYPARSAYLEIAHPDLAAAVAEAVSQGAKRVIVIPCFLAMGVHVREDLPRLVAEQRATFPQIEILISQPLEGHPGLAGILLDRVREVLDDKNAAENTDHSVSLAAASHLNRRKS
jgi:sirohydrochlorin ferrochelatase